MSLPAQRPDAVSVSNIESSRVREPVTLTSVNRVLGSQANHTGRETNPSRGVVHDLPDSSGDFITRTAPKVTGLKSTSPPPTAAHLRKPLRRPQFHSGNCFAP